MARYDMHMITLHGIKNCDTVQRARMRLEQEGIAYRFHDFKIEGLHPELAQRWIDALGVDVVVNRKGTSWRKLDEATRSALSPATAASLLAAQPSLVKRPVIEHPGGLIVGFSRADEEAIITTLR